MLGTKNQVQAWSRGHCVHFSFSNYQHLMSNSVQRFQSHFVAEGVGAEPGGLCGRPAASGVDSHPPQLKGHFLLSRDQELSPFSHLACCADFVSPDREFYLHKNTFMQSLIRKNRFKTSKINTPQSTLASFTLDKTNQIWHHKNLYYMGRSPNEHLLLISFPL